MTDIFIKSFNRPYYLDRCLYCIQKFVQGNYQITILDDGTPEKYLQKIQEKYPNVNIIKSKNFAKKNKAIAENLATGKEINGFQIPTDMWINAVKNASEYLIMTEDDVWFIEKIDLDNIIKKTKKHNISLLKLGWLGNYKDDSLCNISSIDDEIENIIPKKIHLFPPFIMNLFFYNKFKFFSLGYRLGFFNHTTKRNYIILNSILMGLWNKDYWLYTWKDANGKVDEIQQRMNASLYYKKNKSPNFLARLKTEAMKTTFQSSATNSYHEYGFDFDVNLFNHLINEAWYNDDFDAMQNFPKDFSLNYIKSFIIEKINIEEYQKWVNQFKNQYKNLGCKID